MHTNTLLRMAIIRSYFIAPPAHHFIRTSIESNNIFTRMHNFCTLAHFVMDFGGAPGFCSRIQATANEAWPTSPIPYNNNFLASLWRLASMLLLLLRNDSTLHLARPRIPSITAYPWAGQGSGLNQACIFFYVMRFFSAVFHRHTRRQQPSRSIF